MGGLLRLFGMRRALVRPCSVSRDVFPVYIGDFGLLI